MTEKVEAIVVGAGVVGLAAARALALAGKDVVVLERAETFGTGTSSRNSEVIHAGIYYPKDSLKARLCVAGKEKLYRFAAERGVEHKKPGKLIVATAEDEVATLHQLKAKAEGNGVHDLEWLDGAAARSLEPALNCVSALLSPSTGIIDSHGLMLSLLGEAEDRGAMVAYNTPFEGGRVLDGGGFRVAAGGMEIECRHLVNAAGLGAQIVAGRLQGMPPERVPPLHLSRGCYFTATGRAPFSHLIYPVPGPASLGTHVTLDLAGNMRFGPDQEWIGAPGPMDNPADLDSLDYRVDPGRADGFYADIRRYYPDLPDGALQPAYSGIRPKIQAPGEAAADFLLQGPRLHGIEGLVNLFGVESPGLTSSLEIAEMTTQLLGIKG